LERLHELAQARFVTGLHNEIQRVLPLHDRLAADLYPMLADIRAAQVIQQHRPRGRVLGRAAFGCVVMSNNE
jgi:hypothetical protein